MKKILLVIAALAFSAVTFAEGFTFTANTGDAQLDVTLDNINIEAKANQSDFTASISLNYGLPQETVTKMMVEEKMEPADIYMAAEIAKTENKPIDSVIVVYKKHRGKGWGVVTKEMGIKPGSAAFKAMKENSVKIKKKGNHDKKEEKGKGNKEEKGHGKGNK